MLSHSTTTRPISRTAAPRFAAFEVWSLSPPSSSSFPFLLFLLLLLLLLLLSRVSFLYRFVYGNLFLFLSLSRVD
jgi:hypothetical protein